MKLHISLLFLVLILHHSVDASLSERLFRRQSDAATSGESEATTEKTQLKKEESSQNNHHNNANRNEPPRLYPDISMPPDGLTRPVGAHLYPPNHGPTPFVPFGMQPGQFPAHPPPPRPMTQADRMQSQSFTSGLGKRLMEMVGIRSADDERQNSTDNQNNAGGPQEMMKALQNSTVVQQLNGGLHSIYGSLSKMYNSTVREQIDLLQDRFRRETENSTNPWQQRMAQQVPMFFKSMAARVEAAQENLNRMWQQASQAKNGSLATAPSASALQGQPQGGFFGSFNQFMDANGFNDPNNFFGSVSRSFGFNQNSSDGIPRQDVATQLMGFWQNSVQPQLGVMRGHIARAWRDLTSSGALAFEPNMARRQMAQGNQLGSGSNGNVSSEVMDDILREVDMNSAEYTLIDAKDDSTNRPESGDQQRAKAEQEAADRQNAIAGQIQKGMISAQRELNQLWLGLSNSLQNAIGNVRRSLNPRPMNQFDVMSPESSAPSANQADPTENEIGGKIKDLSKVQREADTVYTVVQQQQQQAQERDNLMNRFKNFFNNPDFNANMDRFGDSVMRFGNSVTDFWHQIPNRWDNFMTNMQQKPANNKPGSPNTPAAPKMDQPSTTESAPAGE